LQLTDGELPGPGPSEGHEHHQGLAATRLTFDFQPGTFFATLNGLDTQATGFLRLLWAYSQTLMTPFFETSAASGL